MEFQFFAENILSSGGSVTLVTLVPPGPGTFVIARSSVSTCER